jgi:hypothetical protein
MCSLQLAPETVILHRKTDGHEWVGKYIKPIFGNCSLLLLRYIFCEARTQFGVDSNTAEIIILRLASFLQDWHVYCALEGKIPIFCIN